MTIQVLFFGATADIAGKRRMEIEIPSEATASFVFDKLIAEHPPLASHKLLISINYQYGSPEAEIRDGDEIAIFTAVSGG